MEVAVVDERFPEILLDEAPWVGPDGSFSRLFIRVYGSVVRERFGVVNLAEMDVP